MLTSFLSPLGVQARGGGVEDMEAARDVRLEQEAELMIGGTGVEEGDGAVLL